jgi:hypothetical protein
MFFTQVDYAVAFFFVKFSDNVEREEILSLMNKGGKIYFFQLKRQC